MLRVYKLILLFFCLASIEVYSQTFVLQPAKAQDSDGDYVVKLLLKKGKPFRLIWTNLNESALNLTNRNARLIIGRSSNSYKTLEVPVSGNRGDFIPNNINLGAGRYYARITNSTKRTTAEIQADQEANPGSVIYSNEILLLVEASEAPGIINPRGNITNPTPTFQWSAVAGVPSYWLIVSSTPFDIVEDENGDISIEGATIVWQYITKETTAEYGAVNLQSPFKDEAPPLNAGKEYSYTVLNVYEDNNPVYTSPVFGGIIPFTFVDPNAVAKPNLVSPANSSTFFSENTITFQWGKVDKAVNYTINLLQIVTQQGIDVTVPIWTSTTTNTLIEYPAIQNLKNGTYLWNVIANNSNGGGTTSSNRSFEYKVETGEFRTEIISSSDNSSLLGVELSARAISGGVTPSIPYFVQSEAYDDSLVAGTYEFKAVKTGYKTTTIQAEIAADRTKRFNISMEPFSSSLKGLVKDENGSNVASAVVKVRDKSTNIEKQTSTDINGQFNIALSKGSYSVNVQKSGFISPATVSLTINQNEQKDLTNPFVLTNDQATVSGFIYNQDKTPIQRANVTITKGDKSYVTKSNGSGAFQFTVASGAWVISVDKIGFVKPKSKTISLSTGDLLSNQNFTLAGNANQVVGFVRERITSENGTVGTAPFEGITVTAVPNIGSPISVVSEKNGQYTLSLKSGSYTIQAEEPNYTSTQDRELVIGIAIGETVSGMDFELTPNPSSISGVVTLPNGNGVADAKVTIQNIGTAVTSSSGFYKLSVPQGSHLISVSKPGLVSPAGKNISISTGQNLTGVNFTMTPNAGVISGKISSSGEPLSNTTVYAVNNTTKERISVVNNLDGSYSFSIKSGNWYLKAVKPGFLTDSTSVKSVGPGQQLVNQNFSLVKNLTTIRGTITDGTNPLRNVTVQVNGVDGNTFNQSTVTQVNGTFAFSIPAGKKYSLSALKDGYRTSTSSTDILVPEQTVTKDFSLSANPSSVSGVVSAENATPISGAKVIAIDSNGNKYDSTSTKSNGIYLLGLNPGSYQLKVVKPGYSIGLKQTTLSIGQNLTGVNYTLAENFVFISGSVSDENGDPLEQVFVNLRKTGGGGASSVTNQDGSFSFSGLTGGNYTIAISKSGFIEKTILRSAKDGDYLAITEKLTEKNGAISGNITDTNGNALADVTVSAISESGNEYTVITDTKGSYEMSSLELGAYTITASIVGYTSDTEANTSISESSLTKTGINITDLVANNAVINASIKDLGSSTPLKNVQVSAVGTKGSAFGLTNASGVIQLTNLSPGTYSVISSKTGFKSDTTQINIPSSDPNVDVSRTLRANNGKITGTVIDPDGNALGFRVSVNANASDKSYTTLSSTSGAFTFEGIETGLSYNISTDIYKDGYENVEASVQVPVGASQVALKDELEVLVKKASISGSISVSDVTLSLINADSDEIIELTKTDNSGNYTFDFLAPGNYKVRPKKQGYSFSPPVSSTIILGSEDANTTNFNGVANIATLDVLVKNEDQKGVSGVDVTIISADTSVILSTKTGSSGIARFSKIQASTYYIVRPVKEGFTAEPTSKDITLQSGDSLSTSFLLMANSSGMSGVVNSISGSTESAIQNATVTAILVTTGQTFEAQTNKSGIYNFSSVAAGAYTLIANKQGFTPDTIEVTVNAGQELSVDDLSLSPAAVRIRGDVKLSGEGVSEITVTALSTATYETVTNASGRYQFSNLPIKTGANDTTVYQIKIVEGVFSRTYTAKITSDKVGKTITMPVTNLPSGKIELLVTDGDNPIEGAEVVFGISGGATETELTGNDGQFLSSENLRKAVYTVSVSKEGYLYPQNTIRVELPSDTTSLQRNVYLPYKQLEVNEILADERTKVRVVNAAGYDNSGASGSLFYKKASESQYSEASFTVNGDTLEAFLPVFGSVEEVSFYASISDTNRSNVYVSSESSIVPLASGILSNIRVTPTIDGQSLRVGDSYNIELFVRDGINKSLESEFDGSGSDGSIEWEVLSEDSGLRLYEQEGTSIKLDAEKAGFYKVQVLVNLDGTTITENLDIEVSNIPIKEISVGIPGKQIANSEDHLFSYSAVDTSGGSVILGESLKWEVVPPTSGTVDERGLFQPENDLMIGSFRVKVSDPVSNKTGVSDLVELIAQIEPEASYTLSDGNGLEINFEEGSVDIPSQLSLGETTPPATKKFVFAQGTNTSFTVSDKIYVLSFSGSDLKKAASLILPSDSSLVLNTGEKRIGRFNFTTLQWEILEESNSKSFTASRAGAVSIEQLGQFALMAENEPLGIKYAAVLPSPFSPEIAPVKIGYWLDTAFPPAKVNIRIFNVRGELVRTLLDDDLQQPGRYGSSSSAKEIIWDGLTDSGNMARNGRYIIQIKAKDQQDEVVKLLQVVLVK